MRKKIIGWETQYDDKEISNRAVLGVVGLSWCESRSRTYLNAASIILSVCLYCVSNKTSPAMQEMNEPGSEGTQAVTTRLAVTALVYYWCEAMFFTTAMNQGYTLKEAVIHSFPSTRRKHAIICLLPKRIQHFVTISNYTLVLNDCTLNTRFYTC